jgi:NADP-dependent 3-hydroxy-3-methylglutaryl-CoA reductase
MSPARTDRRAGHRLAVDRARGLALSFAGDGVTVTGTVVGVAEGGATIELDGSAPFHPAGTALAAATLAAGDGTRIELPGLVVQRCDVRDGRLQATLTTADPTARAALWYLMLRLQREGDLVDTPPVPIPTILPHVPQRLRHTEEARLRRLEWMRERSRALLSPLQTTRLDAARLSSNIENLIGAVEVPVGVAGPLLFRGQLVRGLSYVPMATTEGALVASTCRGALAITRSGGVITRVIGQRMVRAPLFVLADLGGAAILADWVRDHLADLQRQVRQVSAHARLVSVTPVIIGRSVHVLFAYETGDAAGQNMSTACTWRACQWLLEQMKLLPQVTVEEFMIEANMSGDKKVSYASFIAGRGIRVVAEALVTREVLKRHLDVTTDQVLRLHGCAVAGGMQSGTIGYNINLANVVAAVFAATGQDLACVHESSVGLFDIERAGDGLRLSLVLPSLVIGTVGGGTHLPAQQALLEMIDCAGRGRVRRLAELIAGFCLSLELSTACAVAGGQFAEAHDRLGRNRPVKFFAREDLTPALFEPGLRRITADPGLQVVGVDIQDSSLGASIMARLTVSRLKKLVGLFPVRVRTAGRDGERSHELLVKVKPLSEEAMIVMDGMALMSGARMSAAWRRHRYRTVFTGTHLRELGVCGQDDPRFLRHVPHVCAIVQDELREAYVLVMERLRDVDLMDSADDPSGWDAAAITAALEGIAAVHAVWIHREDELAVQPWLGPAPSAAEMHDMADLWEALALHAAEELSELVTAADLEAHRELVRTVGDWWARLEALPRTLIHNDFNPRNLALRRTAAGPRLVAYDWELCTLHVPQHDCAELLAFVLGPDATDEEVTRHVETHRRALERESQCVFNAAVWREGYALALRDLLLNRVAFYLMGHSFGEYRFIERVYRTLKRLLAIEAERGTLEPTA